MSEEIVQQASDDIETLESKIEKMEQGIEELEKRKQECEQKNKELQIQNWKSNPNNTLTNDQLDQLYTERESLDKEIKKANTKVESLLKKEKRQKSKIKSLRKELKTLEQSIDEIKKDKEKVLEVNDNIKSEISELQANIDAQTKELEKLKDEMQHFTQKRDASLSFLRDNEQSNHRPITQFNKSVKVSSEITAISFSNDHKSIFTADKSCKLTQWSLPAAGEMNTCALDSIAHNIVVSPDQQLAIVPCADKTVEIIDFLTIRRKCELKSHEDECTDAEWIDRNRIISSSLDRTVKIFDINSNSCVSTILVFGSGYSICPTNSDNVFAVGCSDGSIRVVDIRAKKVVQKIKSVHQKQVTSVIKNPGKDTVFSLGLDGNVCETSLSAANAIQKLSNPELVITNSYARISTDPNGGFVAAGSKTGSIVVFDMWDNSQEPLILKHHKKEVVCSLYASNAIIAASGTHLSFWS
ncbi:autophagy-related protein 16-1 isoform X2 [Histomonas meleagridis]|uniref:autophagy-related protein 16-1 isoform X2 n=1 Tax=Histomonas meleagridis TaxID=135588 RepID=UPI00355A1ED8|nr:autophagy-related protein 16-1 isoform X2 [Histomonas meleagridis]KAH0802621.1 autophagy-related protein 16-1 isoform X2 [Histomonas meleagridis]